MTVRVRPSASLPVTFALTSAAPIPAAPSAGKERRPRSPARRRPAGAGLPPARRTRGSRGPRPGAGTRAGDRRRQRRGPFARELRARVRARGHAAVPPPVTVPDLFVHVGSCRTGSRGTRRRDHRPGYPPHPIACGLLLIAVAILRSNFSYRTGSEQMLPIGYGCPISPFHAKRRRRQERATFANLVRPPPGEPGRLRSVSPDHPTAERPLPGVAGAAWPTGGNGSEPGSSSCRASARSRSRSGTAGP